MEKQVGLKVTKGSLGEYLNKSLLVIAKEVLPETEERTGITISFNWKKRKRYVGYSGASGMYGYRTGNLEEIHEIKISQISESGECCLLQVKTWDYNKRYEEVWKSEWITVDSLLDYYFFIEELDGYIHTK
jgi:hypothetical protein